VQPNEAVYMKVLTKKPGLTTGLAQTEINLSYKSQFKDFELTDGAPAFPLATFLLHQLRLVLFLSLPQPMSA
jgi:glucose-6-phosphate 1-dehydrogenase